MRAYRKSSLSLVMWLAILATGYLVSRERMFAAGGQQNCPPCKTCELFNQVSTGIGPLGYTASGTRAPFIYTAFAGSTCNGGAGSGDLYGVENCYFSSCPSPNNPPVPLTIWNVVGGSNTCKPASPPPPGTYELQNTTITSGLGSMNQNGCYIE